MSLYIDLKVYQWLANLQVIEQQDRLVLSLNDSSKLLLDDPDLVSDIYYGTLLARVLYLLLELNPEMTDVRGELGNIRESQTQPTKLTNWNILSKCLASTLDLRVSKGSLILKDRSDRQHHER